MIREMVFICSIFAEIGAWPIQLADAGERRAVACVNLLAGRQHAHFGSYRIGDEALPVRLVVQPVEVGLRR